MTSGAGRLSSVWQGVWGSQANTDSHQYDEVVSASGLPLYLKGGRPSLPGERTPFSRFQKRTMDLVISISALLVLAPALLLIALAIKVTSPGPIFFRQMRVGHLARPFRIYKFRTLKAEACDDSGVRQVADEDDRITPIGGFLRKSSLDELPQLFNIVLGQMSLVGPRPHVAGQEAAGRPYDELVPYYALRTQVVPGLTGWAQANGLRGSTADAMSARARIEHDLAYVQHESVLLDVRIVLQTLRSEFLRLERK